MSLAPPTQRTASLAKTPSGIKGLDEILGGGLPSGRPTLVCGAAGCGKTLLATEFLVHGATRFDEPGVFMAFEERADDLVQNAASLGFDLDALVAQRRLFLDHVHIERSEIEETGEYDLEGLFIRLEHAVSSIGARRVALDTLEALFGGLSNEAILRAELRRLFRWIKERELTAVITAERGEGVLTRRGLEEYVSDCVILLDHRVNGQVATRRLRVVKYRGSTHGTNEYPFLIDERGIDVLPVTSVGLDHEVTSERISSGFADLDAMVSGGGFYRGSSLLVSGSAGTGKTSVAAELVRAACARGERCLYFAFEEASGQILRNMRSIGVDLRGPAAEGLLKFHCARPTLYGLEPHLAAMHKQIAEFDPQVVVIDPVTNFSAVGSRSEVAAMLIRLVDFLKSRRITGLFTSLSHDVPAQESSDVGFSSLIDTWIQLTNQDEGGRRRRRLFLLKSRGMAHSNEQRELVIGDDGLRLTPVGSGDGNRKPGTNGARAVGGTPRSRTNGARAQRRSARSPGR